MLFKGLYVLGFTGIIGVLSNKRYNEYVEMQLDKDPKYIKTIYFPTLELWKKAIRKDKKNELIDDIPPEYKNLLTLNDFGNKYFLGKDSNKHFTHIPLYKITNQNEKHYNMKYETGENIDINKDKFGIVGKCFGYDFFCDDTLYGIYFSDNPTKWGKLYEPYDKAHFIRKVTIPDDAQVIIGYDEVRADKVILGERTPYKDFNE